MINIHSKCTIDLTLVLLGTIFSGCILFASDGVFKPATAQPKVWTCQCQETTASPTPSGLAPYNNPNLGFSLECPTDWRKEESLSFTSPQGGTGDRAPEVINVVTEVLPSSDFSFDSYTDAARGQVESFENFQLINSSSTTLGGLPAHMIVYTFTDEQTHS